MCMLCAGASHTDVIDHYVRIVDEHGWATVGVTGELPWAYTVGLTWNLGHPELICVGLDPTAAASVLRSVVERIEEGMQLTAGSSKVLLGSDLGFGRVDPRNLLGEWFTLWSPIARAAGHGTASLRALQVRLDELDDCDYCFELQRALERRCRVDALAALEHP